MAEKRQEREPPYIYFGGGSEDPADEINFARIKGPFTSTVEYSLPKSGPAADLLQKLLAPQKRHTRKKVDMSDHPTKTELDAQLAKAAAEADTKIARMEGKLDLVIAKLDYALKDNDETRDTIRSEARSARETTWTVGLGLLAVIIAVLALFPTIFDMGARNQDSLNAAVKKYLDEATRIQATTTPPPAAQPAPQPQQGTGAGTQP
jgi:hypothetical protein